MDLQTLTTDMLKCLLNKDEYVFVIDTMPPDLIWYKQLMHWGRDKMAAITQKAFSNAPPWMKTFEFYIKLKYVPYGLIDNMAALVQIMAWRQTGNKPLSEPMLVC